MHWKTFLNPVELTFDDVQTWVIYSLHSLVTECTCVIDMKIGQILKEVCSRNDFFHMMLASSLDLGHTDLGHNPNISSYDGGHVCKIILPKTTINFTI